MLLEIILIIAAVLLGLFLLSIIIYFFNLDMKFAAKMTPLMIKFYDWKKKKQQNKK